MTSSTRSRRPITLQRRLILTITAIVSLILVFVAVATSAILGGVLEGRLDENVQSAQARTLYLVSQAVHKDPDLTAAQLLALQPGVEPGLLLAVETASGVSGAVVTADRIVSLTDAQIAQISASLQGPGHNTVTIDGLGSYRIAAEQFNNAVTVVGQSRADVAATIGQMLVVIALLTLGGLLLLGVATAWTVRSGLRPLRTVTATAQRVAELPLDQGAVTIAERVAPGEADARTEVGSMGAALNTLLDHVDASLAARQRNEERMRRFVADASHELRTPLASIRGYSELSLRAIAQAGPERAAETTGQSLDRIQAQSIRMTGIVEDLLLLARLDEGKELTYGTVDLTRMVIEAVGDAQVAGTDHQWIIDVPEEPVTIVGDAARLQQVVVNLLQNARVHTPADTVVTSSVAIEADEAVVRVHDNGPGVPAAVQGELFERFARADVSRARQSGGSGLGLSIVRAIVEAHHGAITVDSAPGDTTFTVRLPIRVPAPVQ